MSTASGCAAVAARLLGGPADAGAAWAEAGADASAEISAALLEASSHERNCSASRLASSSQGEAWTFASVFAIYSSVFDKSHSERDNGFNIARQKSGKWWVYILVRIGLVDQEKIDRAMIDAGLEDFETILITALFITASSLEVKVVVLSSCLSFVRAQSRSCITALCSASRFLELP
jgi:hypothetical protein